MELAPDPWWACVPLALVLLGDAALSVRPPAFIRDCLEGVAFPRDWWWTLVVVKVLASAGLIAGAWLPGIGYAANVGVIAYFVAAAAAHVRANFLGKAFWINCLGMLTLSGATFLAAFVL